VTWGERIAKWPSTHINLITGWVLFVGTILIGWGAMLFKFSLDLPLYTVLLVTTGTWAGVAAPLALVGKRATEKPELTKKTTTTEEGPPRTVTTEEETVSRGTLKEKEGE
jgi:hypothetical protein